eukprot:scaffold89188_cov53-Attheya_sp.AAC.6
MESGDASRKYHEIFLYTNPTPASYFPSNNIGLFPPTFFTWPSQQWGHHSFSAKQHRIEHNTPTLLTSTKRCIVYRHKDYSIKNCSKGKGNVTHRQRVVSTRVYPTLPWRSSIVELVTRKHGEEAALAVFF